MPHIRDLSRSVFLQQTHMPTSSEFHTRNPPHVVRHYLWRTASARKTGSCGSGDCSSICAADIGKRSLRPVCSASTTAYWRCLCRRRIPRTNCARSTRSCTGASCRRSSSANSSEWIRRVRSQIDNVQNNRQIFEYGEPPITEVTGFSCRFRRQSNNGGYA